MLHTKSEQLFVEWCRSSNWQCYKIPEEKDTTADFEWFPSGVRVFAEVKEIVANEDEIQVLKDLATRGFSGAYGEEPGKSVRQKIKDSYAQIKRHSELHKCPAILVLYNHTGLAGFGRIDHYHILVGMFGLQTVPFIIPTGGGDMIQSGPDFFGPKKSVTAVMRRSLSGILSLYEHHEKGLRGYMHHNHHARYPISKEVLQSPACVQYAVSDTEINWKLLEPVPPS
jgi:hypothetical protein